MQLPEMSERQHYPGHGDSGVHLGVTHGNAYWEAGNEEVAFTPDEVGCLAGEWMDGWTGQGVSGGRFSGLQARPFASR